MLQSTSGPYSLFEALLSSDTQIWWCSIRQRKEVVVASGTYSSKEFWQSKWCSCRWNRPMHPFDVGFERFCYPSSFFNDRSLSLGVRIISGRNRSLFFIITPILQFFRRWMCKQAAPGTTMTKVATVQMISKASPHLKTIVDGKYWLNSLANRRVLFWLFIWPRRVFRFLSLSPSQCRRLNLQHWAG